MTKSFFLVIGFILICFSNLFSQEVLKGNFRMTSNCTLPIPTARPLILVDGFETDMESMVLAPDHIESITILKAKSAVKSYGDKANEGVILIVTKPGTQFYKIADFVDASKNVNKSVTRIQLNGKLLVDINKLLIDKTSFPSTMISADAKSDSDCNLATQDTLVITTKAADEK